jgi:ubiquinone/menaquinone biosynthesis C-methylase UbiE
MRLMNAGVHRYQLRCLDKLGFTFRGDESLLDVGCGDGGVARLLRERVGEVVAVDVKGFDKWDAATPGLTFQVANGEDLPFDDASFDLVHSKDSLHHMDRPELALLEYRRVLRPGGAALIVEANRFNPSLFLQMTLLRGHQHFRRSRFEHLVRAVFPETRFGVFEAHYVPGATRLVRLQHAVEERLERIGALRPVLAYNFAVATV